MPRLYFTRHLQEAGFVRSADLSMFEYEGVITVPWTRADGLSVCTPHRVKVILSPSFPFDKPSILPIDADEVIENERHQAPGVAPKALCLYPDDGPGWGPWVSVSELIERIREWFLHYHQKDWPETDRPPDLHLYFPSDGARCQMLYGDDWLKLPDQPCGRFILWTRQDRLVGFAGNPICGTQFPNRVIKDRFLGLAGFDNASRVETGLWFRLNREPEPRLTAAAMLAEIEACSGLSAGSSISMIVSQVGVKNNRDRSIVVGLAYPSSQTTIDLETDFLFLRVDLPTGRHWTRRLADQSVRAFESAPAYPEAILRRTNHTASSLKGKSVCIFGLGALGSSIAVLLAKAGVTAMRFVDSQVLRPGNIIRHEASASLVGLPKMEAMRRVVLGHCPDCVIAIEPTTWDAHKLLEWIKQADLVIDATATPSFSLLLNQLCIQQERTALYCTLYRKACVGRIRIVRPGTDACEVCYRNVLEWIEAERSYLKVPPGPEGDFVEHGCGLPTSQATSIDIESAAVIVARTSVSLLQGREPAGNHCLTVNEVVEADDPILGSPGVYWRTYRPVEECKLCHSGSSSL